MGLDRRGGPGCVRLAVAGIALLVVRVLRHPAPVVEPALFRVPAFVWANVTALVFCLGAVMLAWNASAQARFATDVLPGWIVTGVGIGLALPTLMAAATASLPPAQAATGSAVVNTGRQLGYVLGVAVLVAVLGTLDTPHPGATTGFAGAWWFIAGAAGLGLTPRRRMVYSH
ncbi:hypothetical protein [Amycolatopsis thermoflava]|uniref:hypothetical protein n=1 Tax=Amycolatopsis thermoflava TaxID=84480 RepID=UPI00364B0890